MENSRLKFRAWDEAKKAHWEPRPQGMVHFDIRNVPDFIGHTHNEKGRWERRFTIMQYTGLKDCNGVEIYEGDILAITTDRDGSYMNKVEEYQGIFGFFNITCKQIKNPSDWDKPHNKTDSGWFLNGFSNLAGFDYSKLGEVDAGGNQACVKVIGNIHENPELLEDKQCK